MEQETKMVFIAFASMTNYSNWKRQIALAGNVLHKTSKGMREMNYQYKQQFERATMLKLPIQPLLVLCGVSKSAFISN